MAKTKKISTRSMIQAIMLVVVIGGASLRNLSSPESRLAAMWPELQGFCPFGAVQSIFKGLFDGSYLLRANHSNLWVLLGVLLITIWFGAVFCSTLCPLGTVQEWVGKLGKRLFKKRYNPQLPGKLDVLLKVFRWIVLALLFLSVAGLVAWSLDLINPSYALNHLWTSVVPVSAIVVLVLFLALSLVFERPWCRWFCPYGLVLGALGRLSFFKIRRSAQSCINCGKCDRTCPVHISISSKDAVSAASCNRCMACVSSCPVPQTLVFSLKGRTIIPLVLPILVFVLFFTPLFIASITGWYIPQSLQKSTTTAQATTFSVDDISPMMSLSTLALQADLSQEALASLLGLPQEYDFSTLLIDIEEDDDFMDITVGYIRKTLSQYFSE